MGVIPSGQENHSKKRIYTYIYIYIYIYMSEWERERERERERGGDWEKVSIGLTKD